MLCIPGRSGNCYFDLKLVILLPLPPKFNELTINRRAAPSTALNFILEFPGSHEKHIRPLSFPAICHVRQACLLRDRLMWKREFFPRRPRSCLVCPRQSLFSKWLFYRVINCHQLEWPRPDHIASVCLSFPSHRVVAMPKTKYLMPVRLLRKAGILSNLKWNWALSEALRCSVPWLWWWCVPPSLIGLKIHRRDHKRISVIMLTF